VKCGGSTLIDAVSADQYFASLPAIRNRHRANEGARVADEERCGTSYPGRKCLREDGTGL